MVSFINVIECTRFSSEAFNTKSDAKKCIVVGTIASVGVHRS
jgi:hypothetical protein